MVGLWGLALVAVGYWEQREMNRPGEGDKRKAPAKTPQHPLSLRVNPTSSNPPHSPVQLPDAPIIAPVVSPSW
ncbi:hypothetical protein KSF_083390 [Reticulibacter mediterranei]|uniref:Uncharacterized protein n=1 Tax=Reticulibacter mediterranei TaxID=2778369 RepID=A0A8J3IPF0_9CHLR|nr:hypothetical protein [Reticulibacter mediterranei]GHO98291.1 hypothetical protein KSF_083390 [Reticulibacter mediterranei]